MDNNNLSMDDLLKLAEQKIGNLSDSDSSSNVDNILEQTLHSFSHKPTKVEYKSQPLEPVRQAVQPVQSVQSVQQAVQPVQSVQSVQPVQPVQQAVQPLQQPKAGALSNVKSKLNTLFSKSITVYGFKFTFETLLFIVVAVLVGVLLFKLTKPVERGVKKYKPLLQQLSDKNNKKRVKNNNT